jgi:hypothetical protein
MNLYTLRQLDAQRSIVSEKRVEATGADAALRQLNDIELATCRINVHDIDDQQVCQVNADYWRQRYRRTRR